MSSMSTVPPGQVTETSLSPGLQMSSHLVSQAGWLSACSPDVPARAAGPGGPGGRLGRRHRLHRQGRVYRAARVVQVDLADRARWRPVYRLDRVVRPALVAPVALQNSRSVNSKEIKR